MRREKDERVLGQYSTAGRKQSRELVSELPLPPAGTSEARRIQHEAVVAASAAPLPRDEPRGVIHEPPDRAVTEAGQRGIAARPLDCALRGVHMCDGGPGA